MTTRNICHVAHQNAVNLFIQMDFSIQVNTISMDLSILYF